MSWPPASRQMICQGPGRSLEPVGADNASVESLRMTERPWTEVSRLGLELLVTERRLRSPRK